MDDVTILLVCAVHGLVALEGIKIDGRDQALRRRDEAVGEFHYLGNLIFHKGPVVDPHIIDISII